jgi:spermidine synthase
MGGTLPVLVRAVGSTVTRVGRDAGLLYAVNTLGAAAGTLAAAFVLIQRLGLVGSTLVAVVVNVACGLAALLLARTDAQRPAEAAPLPRAAIGGQPVRAVLAAFAVSGFLALAYEVLWTRYLIYVLGENSVHAFALMLASFLIGLTVGSAAAGPVSDRSRNPAALLGVVMVLIGAAAIATASAIGLFVLPRSGGDPSTFWTSAGWQAVKCLGILIVPTGLSGATFALAARAAASGEDRRGRDLGRVYAANTVGAIAGAVAGASWCCRCSACAGASWRWPRSTFWPASGFFSPPAAAGRWPGWPRSAGRPCLSRCSASSSPPTPARGSPVPATPWSSTPTVPSPRWR